MSSLLRQATIGAAFAALIVAAVACSPDAPTQPRINKISLSKACMMTSFSPGIVLQAHSDIQYLWTVPIVAEWRGSTGFVGNTMAGGDEEHWWRFQGDYYCEDEGGGGGTLYPNLYVDPNCNPRTDPRCVRDLTAAEKLQLLSAISSWARDTLDPAMSDSLKLLCGEIIAHTAYHMQNGSIRTASNGESNPDIAEFHYAAFDPNTGQIHVEPWLFPDAQTDQRAQWEMANSTMHEVLHILGYFHTEPNVVKWSRPELYKGTTFLYFEVPFTLLNYNNTAGCMRPYPL